jgi:hypothetical protein
MGLHLVYLFIYSLFNENVSCCHFIASNRRRFNQNEQEVGLEETAVS